MGSPGTTPTTSDSRYSDRDSPEAKTRCRKHAQRPYFLCRGGIDWELPTAVNIDGRPVWEPPVLDYSHLVDTEHAQPYTKRKDAVLLHTGGDIVKTTKIMDTFHELELLTEYIAWVPPNIPEKGDTLFTGSFVDCGTRCIAIYTQSCSKILRRDMFLLPAQIK